MNYELLYDIAEIHMFTAVKQQRVTYSIYNI